MSGRLLDASDRWFNLLLRLYPADFRDEMGRALVETYRDRAREALDKGGVARLTAVWLSALVSATWNGPLERLRPAAAWRRSGNWGRDAELALRRLMRAPMFAVAVAGTLTIGLGAFAVVYTVVQKILIDPMPYKDPDDLYFVWRDYGPIFELKRGWLGGTDVAELQKAGGVIQDAAALARQLATFSVREGADPTEISVAVTSPNLFDLLGVSPIIGRGFASSEAGPGRPAVMVLTHRLWTRLGAEAGIVGRDVRLNGEAFTVIGVLPATFEFARHSSLGPPQQVDAYTTLTVNLRETNPGAGSYAGLVRARPGSPPESVTAAVNAVGRTVDSRDFQSRGLQLYPVGLKPDLIANVRPALLILGVSGGVLLLVLMVNLASVLLARAAQREHELAVSRALGANSAALARAMLFEGALLAVAGGTAGALLAVWGTRTLVALAPLNLPRREAVFVDWRIAAVVIATAMVLGLIAALGPATWAARTSLTSLLANSAVRGGGGHGRLRRGMVVLQVALSLVLLTTGGLVVRSFERLLRADPGFNPHGLLTFRLPIPTAFLPEAGPTIALQDRIEQALGAIPGVAGVSGVNSLPLTAAANQSTVRIPGAPGNTGNAERDAPLVDIMGARGTYFEVMGIRVTDGRTFERTRRDGVREALIDRLLARHFFPTGSPLGAQIPFGNQGQRPLTVVGVFEQARIYDVHQDGRPQLVVRAEDWGYRTLAFVVRTTRDPESLIPDIRGVVRSLDSRLAISEMRTMDDVVGDALRQQRISAVLVAGFALGALLLAAMGLFGVVSGTVTRRRHELAVRLALGADHGRVLRLVLKDGGTLVGAGMLVGVPAVYAAGKLIRGALVGVSPFDPATLAAVAAGLALVAMAACYVPARRVLRLDPAHSLRTE